jgi:D-alanyl-D-alanine carboxypeptidase/D-alanyl-D-alanine-endopeptidase (penicillin-binding protein 4)
MFSFVLLAALALDPLFDAPTLRGAHAGALVVSADTGQVVYERNADDAFVPASTMKLLVGSAALDTLGNAFSFVTTVSIDGTNLYLRGGGDPTLQESDLDEAARTARTLAATRFISELDADDTHFHITRYPDGWQVDDLPNDYAAPVSALGFSDNAIHVEVRPAGIAGAPAAIVVRPDDASLRIENDATTGAARSEDTTALDIAWSQPNTIRVTGSIPLDAHDPSVLDGAMLDPTGVVLDLFNQSLGHAGLIASATARAPAPPGARVLWQHRSAALSQLLGSMWQPSDNLIAETLLDELGSASDGDSRANGIARETAWMQTFGVDPKTLTIADGSGMSAYDRVTPRALVAILAHDWNGPGREVVLSALPQPGQAGTLEHVFVGTPLVGHLFAKTGTSNHTRTLAGYLRTAHGTFIFALLVNDWMDPAPDAPARLRLFQQAFLTAL